MKSDSYESDINELHSVQLEILKAVIELCNQENITYFALGGTMLGAVREAGVIEWDDDIDIGMMRSDYEKFIRLASTKLNPEYRLIHYTTEPNCYTYFAKVMKKGTYFVEDYYSDVDTEQGIFIDIKPIDLLPNSRFLQLIHSWKVRTYEQLFLAKVLKKASAYNKRAGCLYHLKSIIRISLHYAVKYISREKLFLLLDNCLKKYNGLDGIYASFRTEKKTKGLVQDYMQTVNFKFNDLVIAVPSGYSRLLKNQFGNDYMIPYRKETGHRPKYIRYE